MCQDLSLDSLTAVDSYLVRMTLSNCYLHLYVVLFWQSDDAALVTLF